MRWSQSYKIAVNVNIRGLLWEIDLTSGHEKSILLRADRIKLKKKEKKILIKMLKKN